MAPGEAWYLNLDLPHSVENRGDSDRVHLLIDCRRNAWLERLLAQLAGDELARTRATRGGATVWLTGRKGAGRTALGMELADRMQLLRQPVRVLDDDIAAHAPDEQIAGPALAEDASAAGIADHGPDAGRSRFEAAAGEALAVARRGEVAVVGIACPSAADRQRVRVRHEQSGLRFVEVFVDCQREVCDVRVQLLQGGRRPWVAGARGAVEFEPPPAPEVTVRSDRQTVGEEAEIVLTSLAQEDLSHPLG